jgi:regulator of replication initiation timing
MTELIDITDKLTIKSLKAQVARLDLENEKLTKVLVRLKEDYFCLNIENFRLKDTINELEKHLKSLGVDVKL